MNFVGNAEAFISTKIWVEIKVFFKSFFVVQPKFEQKKNQTYLEVTAISLRHPGDTKKKTSNGYNFFSDLRKNCIRYKMSKEYNIKESVCQNMPLDKVLHHVKWNEKLWDVD